MSVSEGNRIVRLNVGGVYFCTSSNTLSWIHDTFFTSLLSGRIPTIQDETGAIFIDRDPKLFEIILNYLRTKQIDLRCGVGALLHEAQFYSVGPLIKRLVLVRELDECPCGDVLYHGSLPAAPLPSAVPPAQGPAKAHARGSGESSGGLGHSRNLSEPPALPSRTPLLAAAALSPESAAAPRHAPHSKLAPFAFDRGSDASTINNASQQDVSAATCRVVDTQPVPIHAAAAAATPPKPTQPRPDVGHARASSADYLKIGANAGTISPPQRSIAASYAHANKGSCQDVWRQLKSDMGQALRTQTHLHAGNPYRVRAVRANHNWVAVAYELHVACFRMKDSLGWLLAYVSGRMPAAIGLVALHAKVPQLQSTAAAAHLDKLLAVALLDQRILLFGIGSTTQQQGADAPNEFCSHVDIGEFTLGVPVDRLFFIGTQLVALAKCGRVGIWHAANRQWTVQEVAPVSSCDTAGSFLLLGCTNGRIYYIDMQKFPLRLKDGDLLVTELYRDPLNDPITAISVYLTPKTNLCGNWIEIAYGTRGGKVRVIVQHPETVGHGPQLFQTFACHRSPVSAVALTATQLISVCADFQHVRSWAVARFRGMISTQPGGAPAASFRVVDLAACEQDMCANGTAADAHRAVGEQQEAAAWAAAGWHSASSGPFGEQDSDQWLFVQQVVPGAKQLFVRLASNGDRVCVVKSVDGSAISCFLVHETDGSSRMGSRPRRYLFTGHSNGTVQMWDVSTALDNYYSLRQQLAGGGSVCSAGQGGMATSNSTPSQEASRTAGGGPSPGKAQSTSGGASASVSSIPLHSQLTWHAANTSECGPAQGPSAQELLSLVDNCDIVCNSLDSTPCSTPLSSAVNLQQ